MPDFDFSHPQRQSEVGLILIFGTSLYQLTRSLWVLGVYFLVGDVNTKTLLFAIFGAVVILLLTLGYSILYYLNFKFHIDQKNREFVLQKGVFSSDVLNIPFEKIQQVNFKRNILQRVIGVYSVVVETAGSQEKEVEIKALSREKANELADQLMSLAKKHDESLDITESEEFSEDVTSIKGTPEWEHHVSLFTLLKLGLTSNYLRGVSILFAFYFTLREQFFLNESLPGEMPVTSEFIAQSGTFLLILFLILLGMIITVSETIIKYYDLNIKKFKDTLQVEMGLRNNTRVNLKARRIQLMQVLTNPIQKKLGLYKMKIALASSENDLQKGQITIPGLPPEVVEQVKEFFYKKAISSHFFVRPTKYLLIRKISRGLLPLLIGLVLGYIYRDVFSASYLGVLASLYLVLMAIYNYFYFKSLKLEVSDEFVVKYSGVWIKKKQYVESYRLQSVSIQQPLWYKRRGIVNLTFHSASGDIPFKMVKQEQVTPLINFLLYKIEATERAWM